ncbi:hypothetical protein EVAR_59446_1 [Eumeta japonica]|uniref:Uncharacterized protein n=1 Tax=Eumeta variegata TaxID=151549 RepID=A0A4C1Z351_EUMVA|nr:hypothetical protein EVAR_59446_1 [Eumeta japonica]
MRRCASQRGTFDANRKKLQARPARAHTEPSRQRFFPSKRAAEDYGAPVPANYIKAFHLACDMLLCDPAIRSRTEQAVFINIGYFLFSASLLYRL